MLNDFFRQQLNEATYFGGTLMRGLIHTLLFWGLKRCKSLTTHFHIALCMYAIFDYKCNYEIHLFWVKLDSIALKWWSFWRHLTYTDAGLTWKKTHLRPRINIYSILSNNLRCLTHNCSKTKWPHTVRLIPACFLTISLQPRVINQH